MNLKGNGRTQGIGFSCVMAVLVAALLILAGKTVYDYKSVRSQTRLQTLRQRHTSLSVPDPSAHLQAFGMTGSAMNGSRSAVSR